MNDSPTKTLGRLSVQVKSICRKAPSIVIMVQGITKMGRSMFAQGTPFSKGRDASTSRVTRENALVDRAAAKVVVLAEMASSIPT